MAKLKKSFMYVFGFFIIIFLLGYGMAYNHCSSSEAYLIADNFIKSNKNLKDEIGDIKETKMAFSNFLINEKNGEGQARFSILVTGSKKNTKVDFDVSRNHEVWFIKSAKFKNKMGTDIQLIDENNNK